MRKRGKKTITAPRGHRFCIETLSFWSVSRMCVCVSVICPCVCSYVCINLTVTTKRRWETCQVSLSGVYCSPTGCWSCPSLGSECGYEAWSLTSKADKDIDFQCRVEAQGGPAVYELQVFFHVILYHEYFLRSLFVSSPRALCLLIELNGFATVDGNFRSTGIAPWLGIVSKQRRDELGMLTSRCVSPAPEPGTEAGVTDRTFCQGSDSGEGDSPAESCTAVVSAGARQTFITSASPLKAGTTSGCVLK